MYDGCGVVMCDVMFGDQVEYQFGVEFVQVYVYVCVGGYGLWEVLVIVMEYGQCLQVDWMFGQILFEDVGDCIQGCVVMVIDYVFGIVGGVGGVVQCNCILFVGGLLLVEIFIVFGQQCFVFQMVEMFVGYWWWIQYVEYFDDFECW